MMVGETVRLTRSSRWSLLGRDPRPPDSLDVVVVLPPGRRDPSWSVRTVRA